MLEDGRDKVDLCWELKGKIIMGCVISLTLKLVPAKFYTFGLRSTDVDIITSPPQLLYFSFNI